MRDKKNKSGKNKSGYEYIRYLKFMLDKEHKALGKSPFPEVIHNEIFPPELDLKPKSSSQWSHTDPKDKIKQGVDFYKIELPDTAHFGSEVHSNLSSAAHGNPNTTYMLKLTPEESLRKLRADLTSSIKFFNVLLESALKCYIHFYLGQYKDYREIVESMNSNE